MRATITARNTDSEYEITITDDDLRRTGYVDLKIQATGEDYYETWKVNISDLYDLVNLFDNRK